MQVGAHDLLLSHNINFAVESIAPGIVGLRWDTIKEQIAVFAQTSSGVGNAHAELPSFFPLLGPGIDACHQLPAGGPWVSLRIRCGIEIRVGAIAGKEIVDLRTAAAWMPGIGVDLRDVDQAAQIDEEAPAVGIRVEEEVRMGLVFVNRQKTIGESTQAGPIRVLLAYHERQLGLSCSIVLGGRWHMLEFEILGGVRPGVAVNRYFYL